MSNDEKQKQQDDKESEAEIKEERELDRFEKSIKNE